MDNCILAFRADNASACGSLAKFSANVYTCAGKETQSAFIALLKEGHGKLMAGQGRCCDHCGRPVRGRPGIIVADDIFCSLVCKRTYPAVLRRRLIRHYLKMADEAAAWVAKTLDWQSAHPEEEPLDVEPLRLVERGARDIVDSLRVWGPIPERSLRLLHSAMTDTDAC